MMTSHVSAEGSRLSLLVSSFNDLRRKDSHTDCVLVGKSKKFRCHRVILAVVSPVLQAVLPQPGEDKEDITLLLPDWDDDQLEIAIDMIYSGRVGYMSRAEGGMLVKFMKYLGVSWSSEEMLVNVDAGEKPPNICSDGAGGRFFVGTTEVCDIDLRHLVGQETAGCGQDEPDYVISPCYEYDDTEEESEFSNFNSADLPNSAEDQIPLKEMSVSDICSKNCRGQCGQVYKSFTENEKSRMQTMFKSEKSLETKRKLLAHLQSQLDCGLNTDGYHLINHTFCCTFLEHQINISKFILNSVLKDFWNGCKFYEHGNAGVMKTKASTSIFIAWLKQFSDSYGQYAPDSNITVLSYWLNKKVLYDMYLDETLGPHLRPTTFYESFKTYFGPNRQDQSLPHIRISKYSSHSICNLCTALNTNKRQAQSEGELKVAQDKINHHKKVFGDARRKVDEIIQSALSFPADNLGRPFKIICWFLIV